MLVRAERFVAGGESLGHDVDGRIVFVSGGVPGDEVMVEITERKGDWMRGRVTEVVTPSADRIEPPCPSRLAGCGGCDWQHVSPDRQLDHKLTIVADALRRTARLPGAKLVAGGSVPNRGYRTTIRVVGGDDRSPAYRVERSHLTVPASGCMIAHPALVELLSSISLPPGVEVSLRVSAATGEATADWDRRLGDISGLPHHVGIGPLAVIHEQVAGHGFQVSAGSFFQSGPAAAELLVDALRRAAPELTGARSVLDAYAGVGLFALAATDPDSYVTTIESTRSSVADSRVNLGGRRARVEQLEVGRWRPRGRDRFDVVIADPARTGLGKPGVAAVVSAKAPVIVLVSCDPVAMARDVALLAGHGYQHDGGEVLDLFPQTHHVEVVTRFVLAD